MKVLLIRHGIAEEREVFARTGASDDERPLTTEGRAEMHEIARGLAQGAVRRIKVIAASPLVRAEQTAAIVSEAFPHALRRATDALRPEAAPEDFLEWLVAEHADGSVAAVGHDPHLSGLACWLIGAPEGVIRMKKGSALLVEFEHEPGAGAAELRWFMTPGQLRRLGRP